MKIMKTTGWLLIVVCAWALLVSSQEGNEGGVRSAILTLEREWEVAQARNDNRAMDRIFDNALVYIEYGRLVTKSEYLERIHSENPNLRQVVMEPMTVRTFGNTATVVGTYREIDIVNGKAGLQRWRFVDTWVYKKSGGVLVAAAAVPLTK
jgi:hypothetical protein